MPPKRRHPARSVPALIADDDDVPLVRPSNSRSAPSTKPLVDLTEADLRAAGVQFFDGVDVAGMGAGDWVQRSETGWAGETQAGKTGRGGGKPQAATVELEEEYELDPDAQDPAIEAFWDEFFDALMLTVPFSFLYLMLDILTNLSYARHPAFSHYMKNYLMSTPTIGMIVFYSSRYTSSWAMRALLTATSIGCGTRLIWLVNKASYLTVLTQAPAMGTLWIITIVQLPLTLAVGALATVFVWLYQRGLKLVP